MSLSSLAINKNHGKPLKDMSICISFGEQSMSKVEKAALSLGAKVTRTLSATQTTCLIVERVDDKLYHEALSLKLPVVTLGWLRECLQKKELVLWDLFAVPLFHGLRFCCTRISPSERQEVIKEVERHGGTYSDQLEKGKTTHLITEEREGTKYHAAQQWGNIKIVSQQWIKDCVGANKFISESNYLMSNKKRRSSSSRSITSSSMEKGAFLPATSESTLKPAVSVPSSSVRKGNAPSERKRSLEEIADESEMVSCFSAVTYTGNIFRDVEKYLAKSVSPSLYPPMSAIDPSQQLFLLSKTFFVVGYPSPVQDYLIKCILHTGGHVSFSMHQGVHYVVEGPDSNKYAGNQGMTAEQISLLWFFDRLFDEATWLPLLQSNSSTKV